MILVRAIEKHLARGGISPTRFGRDVAGDPRLVFDLRRGRMPRPALQARILAALAQDGARDGEAA